MRDGWVDSAAAATRSALLGAGLVLVLATLTIGAQPISERLVPDPRMNRKLELAEAALARVD